MDCSTDPQPLRRGGRPVSTTRAVGWAISVRPVKEGRRLAPVAFTSAAATTTSNSDRSMAPRGRWSVCGSRHVVNRIHPPSQRCSTSLSPRLHPTMASLASPARTTGTACRAASGRLSRHAAPRRVVPATSWMHGRPPVQAPRAVSRVVVSRGCRGLSVLAAGDVPPPPPPPRGPPDYVRAIVENGAHASRLTTHDDRSIYIPPAPGGGTWCYCGVAHTT
jgi:hypothetical protein